VYCEKHFDQDAGSVCNRQIRISFLSDFFRSALMQRLSVICFLLYHSTANFSLAPGVSFEKFAPTAIKIYYFMLIIAYSLYL
jgi:hypothetical protein